MRSIDAGVKKENMKAGKSVMTAKRWFLMLGCILLIIAVLIATLNIIVDPFSVFEDSLYPWPSYGMTNNPKTAKFNYIDKRRGEFDAFIIGPSGASGISPDKLGEYTGLRWYNMFNYGADMEYTKRQAEYLARNHHPAHILLCLPVISAWTYKLEIEDITYYQPLSPFWRVPFAFASPKYSKNKIEYYEMRSYFQQWFDNFTAETGVYNKTLRDAESIGPMAEYLVAYPEFVNPWFAKVELDYIDKCARAVAEVIEICASYGIELTVVTSPILADNIRAYDQRQVQSFYEAIAGITGFWDFSVSSISNDPRYFYDVTHFRNSVGEMMLARIFGDDSIYIPEDFGVWVTSENAASTAELFGHIDEAQDAAQAHTMDIPVLRYSHIGDESGISAVSPARFEEHMRALYEAGYSAVSLRDIYDYVMKGHELPDHSVVVTFDDGYLSNYTQAFPVLQHYEYSAAIFVTGDSFGKDTGLDPLVPALPHFGAAEALEMTKSGLITIQGNSYSMNRESGAGQPMREGITRMDDETEAEYIEAFISDFTLMSNLLKENDVDDFFAFSYPKGIYDTPSAILLRNSGIDITFTMDQGTNTLIKGLPQSLLELKRFTVTGGMTGIDILYIVNLQNSN